MDNIQIFTMGGTDREREVINTVIWQGLTEKGYTNAHMLSVDSEPMEAVPKVVSVIEAIRDYDPSMLTKEINIRSVPCQVTSVEQAGVLMEGLTSRFENYDGGSHLIAGSGTDEDDEIKVTAIFMLEEGPTLSQRRKEIEIIAKEAAGNAIKRADRAVRKQNLHLVKPDVPPQAEKE